MGAHFSFFIFNLNFKISSRLLSFIFYFSSLILKCLVFHRHELLQQQAEWLAEARARILRLAEIGRRRNVLDLGCGSGATLQELQQRCSGSVVAMDLQIDPLKKLQNAVNADALHPPFKNASFDLIFSQNFFLWVPECDSAITQVHRLLQPGGAFCQH